MQATERECPVLVGGGADPAPFDAALVDAEPATCCFPQGDGIRVGDLVRARSADAPSSGIRETCGTVSFVEAVGGRIRLTLLCGPGSPPERMVWLDEVVAVGDDACGREGSGGWARTHRRGSISTPR